MFSRYTFFLFLLLLSVKNPLFAQETIGETDIEPYTFSGNIGLQTHAYTTTRDFNRREPLGALLTANAEYSILGFTSGLDIRYSTDTNEFRQNMNRIQFNGSWRWITLSAGDVMPAYSEFGLRGTQLRGGEIRLSPGPVYFNVTAGQLNKAIQRPDGGLARQVAYERWLYAFAIGAGDENGSNFDISGFYGRDNENSLPDSVRANLAGTTLLPAENVGLTPKFQLSFFEEAFKIGAETTVSAYTRDQNSPEISTQDVDVPDFLINLFQPRNSTRVTYAGIAHTGLNLDLFSMRAEFERIMPGFESMGLRQLRDDQQTLSIYPSFNLIDGRLTIDGTFMVSEDNLLDNRLSTQNRQNMSLNTNARLTDSFSLGGGYSRFLAYTESDGGGGNRDHEQISQIFQLFPSFSFMNGGVSHSITLTGVYQAIDIQFPVQNGTELSESHTITGSLSYGLAMSGGLSFNNSLNYVTGESPGSTFSTAGVSVGAGYAFLEGKMNVNLTLNGSFNTFESVSAGVSGKSENAQLNGNFITTYRLTSDTSFQLNIRSQNNSIITGAGDGFSELEGRFKFQQRF
ncbi:MAG TPA: hypothetical protein VKM37_07500 [Balneolaceae bacterium]|nr:hypothetical protein [Balneolaceae bacterium]